VVVCILPKVRPQAETLKAEVEARRAGCLWNPMGKAPGTLPNAHLGRHFPSGVGTVVTAVKRWRIPPRPKAVVSCCRNEATVSS
jgi:hypothetical protein